jgi:hypothetical protein
LHTTVAAEVVRAETDDGPAAGREQPERTFVLDLRATHLIGAPETGHRGRAELLTAAAAELMLATLVVDSADRLRSFELVAAVTDAAQPPDGRNANSLNNLLTTGFP